jgi:type IV pilus assembly protein PilY1
MKKLQGLVFFLVSLLVGYSATLHAEDTDIYVDNANTAGVPNVLFVIDTGANFSSSASVPCTAYGSGGAPSLADTAGGIEQCALVDAINGLANGVVNIGLLVNNNNNFATDTRAATDVAYHEPCIGTYGGCVIRKLTLMDAAGKASLISFIKSWKTSGQDSATDFNVKAGGDRTGNMMQEAWAYYRGKVGMSGKDYGTTIVGSGCQKNFVIFIGNAFNVSGTPADTGTQSPFDGINALTSAQVGATSDQKIKISETVNFSPATCGVTSTAASTSASNWSENWADEWARLMFQQDGGAAIADGTQNITTYTIGVVNDASCKPDYPALLSTMAKYGGGKYFKTSNSAEVKTALDTVLNEVQAVNSVFSSASLPVSVNAEGSFLNQIFLGMFRPDSTAAPRWLGNLKQYQLVKNASGSLVLGDALGNPAISSAGTGFISPVAVSYWTNKDVSKTPDLQGGFFKNDPKGVPASGYDLPDGEVVEKGGVAQQLRLENLTATFSGTRAASTNPRRLYTYCPSGSGCNTSLTDNSNEFSTANSGIQAGAFGASSTISIVSIVRSGTTALVTTSTDHGYSNGTVVTISNVTQPEYNVTQAITVNSSNTFTITGLPNYPTSPTAGTYQIASVGGSPVSVVSVSRTSSTTGSSNSETATVTTSAAHGFTTSSNVVISGATESAYNYSGVPTAVPTTTSFTFPVTISPPGTAVNVYQATRSASGNPGRPVALMRSAANTIKGTTTSAHGYYVGESITISGAGVTVYNGTYTIVTVPSVTTFTVTNSGLGNPAGTNGTVAPNTSTAKTLSTVTRTGTGVNATATATGAPASWFGNAVGATTVVNIAKLSGSATNESAYVASNVTATCVNATCTSFTYPITVTPALTATGTMTAAIAGSSAVNVAAGAITRVAGSTTATVTGVTSGAFSNGQSVTVTATGTPLTNEAAYLGTWTISCTAPCTSFTYGPVVRTPTTPATGTNMQAYSPTTPPDRDTVIKWVRGADNFGDEKGPGGTVTVRPSIHGDVLHSRPLVVNYGDSRGIVAFYGANDGVYRAVNGNQTTAISGVAAGDELWGLVLPEQFNQLNRLRIDSPELKFPSTTLASALPKDYFVDGPTGAFQQLKADGTIDKAYLFLTMRRGGGFMYALDVSTPTAPVLLWKIDSSTTGFDELGQTWSRPRLTLVPASTDPVLVFGAGYDAAEDSEPPDLDTSGRGIYVINAKTGALIWSANSSCTTSATCLNVPGMIYSIPSDIAFVDRDSNGKTDKFYFGDTGGNVWRADVNDASPANWTVTKIAALGCASGACASGTTPRKFFFPPSVLTVKPSGTSGSYDAISIASGDREHPLKNTATGSSYNVSDRFFMLKDTGTTVGVPATSGLTLSSLFNATSTDYDGTLSGFYITFATGEKAVNAPLAVNGSIFVATNRPVDRSQTCAANLGEAKAYAINPFNAETATNTLPGGGLPPSAVTGLITITTTNADNTTSTSQEKFCIGCGVSSPPGAPPGAPCNSALENCSPANTIPKNLRRTYWYKK